MQRKIKVGLIARGLATGGVTRVITNILKEFNKLIDSQYEFVLFTDNKLFIKELPNIKVIYRKSINKIFWSYFQILPDLQREKCDIVIYPKNIIDFTHYIFPFKKVIIVHDLAYFHKQFLEYKIFDTIYMRTFIPYSCKKANIILAVSNATKNDLIKRFKIDPRRIKVTHEGVEVNFYKDKISDQTIAHLKIKEPYLFYCGTLSPRKNILRTLMAFEQLKDKISHNFYLTGGRSWNDYKVRKYIKENLFDRVFILNYVSEAELVSLYSKASLFLYPSLYEGFGLPILEAQSCGCPVLTSNTTSCPEVAGKGACLVNPYSVNEIKNGILKILFDENYRNNIIKEGERNILKFSWNQVVKRILELI